MKIGIIGTGRVATTLGERLSSRGHAVVYGSREPSGGSATQHEAAASSDIMITAIPVPQCSTPSTLSARTF